MSARRLGLVAPWTVGLALALGLHGAAAALLLARWHADVEEIASAPAILVDFAPAPVARAAKPTPLPPGPPQPQQQAQPEPRPTPKSEQQPERKSAPKQIVAKTKVEAPPQKPVEQTIDLPLQSTPQAAIELPPAPAAQAAVVVPPKTTIAVLPPRKPVEIRHKSRSRQARRASAPSSAARRATRTAALAPGASTHHSNALPNWRSALVARIERHKHYPEAALARGEHGVAQVAFSVDRSGRLHDARIVRSSGSKLLDRDALAWLRRSEPLPPPPPEVHGARISVVVPLRYEIR